MAAPSTAAITSFSGSWLAKGVYESKWTATVSGAGIAESAVFLPDKTVYLAGLASTNTSAITLEGSNATTPTGTYYSLRHPIPTVGPGDTGNVLEGLVTGGVFQLYENPRWIRPRATTVTSGASVSVIMVSRGNLR